jgi:FixJ family two-component response regulator
VAGTVKLQRASVMEKLQVGTMAGLAALFEGEDLDRLLGPQAARRKPV